MATQLSYLPRSKSSEEADPHWISYESFSPPHFLLLFLPSSLLELGPIFRVGVPGSPGLVLGMGPIQSVGVSGSPVRDFGFWVGRWESLGPQFGIGSHHLPVGPELRNGSHTGAGVPTTPGLVSFRIWSRWLWG